VGDALGDQVAALSSYQAQGDIGVSATEITYIHTADQPKPQRRVYLEELAERCGEPIHHHGLGQRQADHTFDANTTGDGGDLPNPLARLDRERHDALALLGKRQPLPTPEEEGNAQRTL